VMTERPQIADATTLGSAIVCRTEQLERRFVAAARRLQLAPQMVDDAEVELDPPSPVCVAFRFGRMEAHLEIGLRTVGLPARRIETGADLPDSRTEALRASRSAVARSFHRAIEQASEAFDGAAFEHRRLEG